MLRSGQLVGARIAGRDALSAEKALLRMLQWEDGVFELDSTVPADVGDAEIAPSLNSVLMEAARQSDELAHLAAKNAMPRTELSLGHSKKPWSELTPGQLDILQAIAEGRTWPQILDASARSDLDLTKDVVLLNKHGTVEFD
jgi:hypothetical protein